MDRKEVNSRNFTFKNFYKPSEVCARRYEIVSRLVDHFKNNLGKKKNKTTHAHYYFRKTRPKKVVSRNFRLRTGEVTKS